MFTTWGRHNIYEIIKYTPGIYSPVMTVFTFNIEQKTSQFNLIKGLNADDTCINFIAFHIVVFFY